MDAGPHVKVLCLPAESETVARALAAVPGVTRIIPTQPGGPARLVASP